jgi:hypothetical protein
MREYVEKNVKSRYTGIHNGTSTGTFVEKKPRQEREKMGIAGGAGRGERQRCKPVAAMLIDEEATSPEGRQGGSISCGSRP